MNFTYLKPHSLFLLSFLIVMLFAADCYSQHNVLNTVNASGNDITGSSGSIAYSIGQVFYANTQNNNYQIAEGVQQGLSQTNTSNQDIDVPTDPTTPAIDMLIYPNPTKNDVTLKTEGLNFEHLNSYRVFNYQGQLIQNNSIQQTNTKINLSHLNTGVYILQVFVNEKLWRTFKIVKQ